MPDKGTNPVGRPTKYTSELVEKARHYIDNYQSMGHPIPSIARIARELDISRETVRAWTHEEGKEEFSAILANMLAEQEAVLLEKGLTGEFNSAITKLVLGKHDYHDQSKNELHGPNDGPIQFTGIKIIGVEPNSK